MLNNFSDFLSLTSNLMVKYSNEDTSKLSETLLIAQLLRIEWKLDKLESGEQPVDGSSIQVQPPPPPCSLLLIIIHCLMNLQVTKQPSQSPSKARCLLHHLSYNFVAEKN